MCTYTGRIFGLTTQVSKISVSDSQSRAIHIDSGVRIEKLREEIQELETKVQRERERYKMSTQSMSPGLSAIPMLPVNHSVNDFNLWNSRFLFSFWAETNYSFSDGLIKR